MRVSEHYDLGRTQPTLDFVDVDIETDLPVFLDPKAIRVQDSEWSHDAVGMLTSFFNEILEAIRTGSDDRVKLLLGRLSEPNETHLGFSVGPSRGRGLGGIGAMKVADMLSGSLAARTGLLADLEDSSMLIPGIGPDIVSDITTHVIRGALIGYTQRAASYYGIGLVNQHSGPIWNPDILDWQEGMVDAPRAGGDLLLLVPRSIVRASMVMNKDRYYNRFLAPRLEIIEIDAGSELVRTLKNGSIKVDRHLLAKKYPKDKLAIVKYTQQFPDALPQYKSSISRSSTPPPGHYDLRSAIGTPVPDYAKLLEGVRAIAPGAAGATIYHRAAEKLLTAIFYPYLGNMRLEHEIHDGRKRIDITYDNIAALGTFFWLNTSYRAPTIPVECKNYVGDVANNELDQISGRFGDRRGWIGMIVCRKFKDKKLFLNRCRDTARDGRGYILALDDEDLSELVDERIANMLKDGQEVARFQLIRSRFDDLIT